MNLIQFNPSRPLDAIPIGRITIDFNPVDFQDSFKSCKSFTKYVGGSPANTSVGLAHLGNKVGFIGKVSDDSIGEYVVDYLKSQNVDTSHISRCKNGEILGLAFTEVLPEKGTNLMLYRDHLVADLQLTTQDIDENYIKDAKCVIISGTALSASPSREAAFKALELARKHEVVVVFDIDYRPQIWKSDDEIAIYYSLAAKQADIIMGSREEYDRMDAIYSPESNDIATAKRWFQENAKVIIIKHGQEGSRAYAKNGMAYTVKIVPVKLLKATGGGDAYSSAFISGLLNGFSLKDSLEMATASASMVVGSPSCSEATPSLEKLQAFIKESKEKYGEFVIEEKLSEVSQC